MKSGVVTASLTLLALGLVAVPANAQLFNDPVYFSPAHGTGLTLNGEYARGFKDAKDVNFFGGRALVGLGPISVYGGGGVVAFTGDLSAADNEFTVGGGAALNVLEAPLIPVAVNVQAGVGITSFGPSGLGADRLDVPIGVGVGLKVPSPILRVEPWIAPRVQITSINPDIGETTTKVGYGISGGLNVTLPTGLGVHVAGDYVKISDLGVEAVTLGIGLHYRLAIPGLVPGGIVK